MRNAPRSEIKCYLLILNITFLDCITNVFKISKIFLVPREMRTADLKLWQASPGFTTRVPT